MGRMVHELSFVDFIAIIITILPTAITRPNAMIPVAVVKAGSAGKLQTRLAVRQSGKFGKDVVVSWNSSRRRLGQRAKNNKNNKNRQPAKRVLAALLVAVAG
jgi:hypothetical protein